MLQFWRKPEKKRINSNSGNCAQLSTDKPNLETNTDANYKCYKQSPKEVAAAIHEFEDEGLDVDEIVGRKEKSRLTKTLKDTLASDKNALNYFIQYMECKNASPYIMCWLDIDIFKSDMNLLLNGNNNNDNNSPVPNCRTEHDSLSVSTDCDSFTADSNSLFDYSSSLSSDNATAASKPDQNSSNSNCCDKISDNNCSDLKTNHVTTIDNNCTTEQNHALVDNALMIFKKYIALEATCSIKCPEGLRKEVMENICTSVISPTCFDSVQNYVFDIMETEFYQTFLCSDFYCKYQIDVLTSGNVALDDILYNETALFYFMEFLEQENCSHLLEFWIAANNFQQQLHDQKDFFDPVEAQSDAVVLYDKYFSLQAHCPLGFGDKVRFNVEQNICGENGLMLDCFHLPLKIIERALEKNYLKSFLASQLFYKYLSELISCVETSTATAANVIQRTKSESDCSSERSFSTNTFLALEMDQNVKRREKCSATDMNIDTRQLYDPDALWKRRKSHRLSCGRVTELGKFETDFEPEPDRNEFKLKNVVKKLVNLEEENKKKEELAWQVAEMIVKDITSVTLNENK